VLARKKYQTALLWQIALAAYMQVISWVPLGRWNYQPCCPPGLEALRRGTLTRGDVAGVGVFLLPAALFWFGARWDRRWAMWIAVSATAVWLSLQLFTWWPRYLFGASDQWARVYARAFAESTPILPRWGNHLPPDAAHFCLQVLLAGAVATGGVALLRQRDVVHGPRKFRIGRTP
jgi:hypothetical protein